MREIRPSAPIQYASPQTEPMVPAGQIVVETIGGIVLLVLALIFLAGAVIHLRVGALSWAALYLLVGLAFAWGGGVEIHRGIRHQRRR